MNHRFEHLEPGFLVFAERVDLSVTLQTDGLSEFAHRVDVANPVGVDDAKRDGFQEIVEDFRVGQRFFGGVFAIRQIKNIRRYVGRRILEERGIHDVFGEVLIQCFA